MLELLFGLFSLVCIKDFVLFTNLTMRYWLAIVWCDYNVVSLLKFILLDNIILGYALL